MSGAQSFLLGIMVAYTPSLIVFLWCLRDKDFFEELG